MKPNKQNILNYYIPLFLFLVAFIWKYLFIGERDICLDEPHTIFHSLDSFKNIILLPTKAEPHPPLFNIILHYWVKSFGISPYSVRTVPILFNSLTVIFIYFIGKKFFHLWAALIASGLFLFSTSHFFFGGDTRAYSLLSCATAASLYFFLETIKNPEKRNNLIGLLIANFFLVFSHYFGWFVVFAQFVTSLLYLNNRKTVIRIWMVITATTILYIPMMRVLIKQYLSSSSGTWLTPPENTDFINHLKLFMNSGRGLRVVLIIFGIGILVAIFSKVKPDKWKELLVVLLWWLVPYSIMFFVSQKTPMFTSRYILFNSIGFYLFIGGTIYLLYGKTKIIIPLVSLVIIWVSVSRMKTRDFAIREIKNSTDYVQKMVDEECIVIIYPQWANLGFTYYFAPKLFKQVDNYYPILHENNIIPVWGFDDAVDRIKNSDHKRLIYYQDNAKAFDPTNSIYKHFDSLYYQVDSAVFQGGIKVNVFEKLETTTKDNFVK